METKSRQSIQIKTLSDQQQNSGEFVSAIHNGPGQLESNEQ